MPSDNLTPSSAPREPEAPSEQELLDAIRDSWNDADDLWVETIPGPDEDALGRRLVVLAWLKRNLSRLLASSDRVVALEAELFQLRRWSADASVAFDNNEAGRARTNVERIYKLLLKLTGSAAWPSRPEPLAASRPTKGAET